ncbi:MAG: ATP-binding cassette domain-containing protein [Bacilli bacterium]|nr:ATP-binding cassette domain-containing protein [Bacilli bacterium]
MIELKNISKIYKGRNILNNISFKFKDKGCIGIVGPNGCGKSVLLNCICGFIKPNSGEVIIDNKIIGKDIDYIINAGIIVNSPNMVPHLSIEDNLQLISKILNLKETNNRINILLKYFELEEDKYTLFDNCSQGMKQKTRLIQALMEPSKYLILDEPTVALDHHMIKKLRDLLLELKKDKLIIITSHNDQDIKLLCDEIYEFRDGRIEKYEEIN